MLKRTLMRVPFNHLQEYVKKLWTRIFYIISVFVGSFAKENFAKSIGVSSYRVYGILIALIWMLTMLKRLVLVLVMVP